jgi:hypothetical protein
VTLQGRRLFPEAGRAPLEGGTDVPGKSDLPPGVEDSIGKFNSPVGVDRAHWGVAEIDRRLRAVQARGRLAEMHQRDGKQHDEPESRHQFISDESPRSSVPWSSTNDLAG